MFNMIVIILTLEVLQTGIHSFVHMKRYMFKSYLFKGQCYIGSKLGNVFKFCLLFRIIKNGWVTLNCVRCFFNLFLFFVGFFSILTLPFYPVQSVNDIYFCYFSSGVQEYCWQFYRITSTCKVQDTHGCKQSWQHKASDVQVGV